MNSISRDLDHAIGPRHDAMRGLRMPQPRLADGRLLGDAMTGRCALIAKPHCLAQSLVDETLIMTVDASSHPEVDAILADRRLDAFILRPDFYLLWCGVRTIRRSSRLFGEFRAFRI